MKNYYYILGVKEKASNEEIKKAFRLLSKKFHPDVNSGDKYFEERFKEIQEAYEILIDYSKRKKYDELLVKQSRQSSNEYTDSNKKKYYDFQEEKKQYEKKKKHEEEKLRNEREEFERQKNGFLKKKSKVGFGKIRFKSVLFGIGLLVITAITFLSIRLSNKANIKEAPMGNKATSGFTQNKVDEFTNDSERVYYWSECDERQYHKSKSCFMIKNCKFKEIDWMTADLWELKIHNCKE